MWFRRTFRKKKNEEKLNKEKQKIAMPDLIDGLEAYKRPAACDRYGYLEEKAIKYTTPSLISQPTLSSYHTTSSVTIDSSLNSTDKLTELTSTTGSTRLSTFYEDEYYQTMKRPVNNPYSKSYYSYHSLAKDRFLINNKKDSKSNRLSCPDMDGGQRRKPVMRSRSLSVRTAASTSKEYDSMIAAIKRKSQISRRPSQRSYRSENRVSDIILMSSSDVSQPIQEKDTILHSACRNGQIDIVRFYVESKRYLNKQNRYLNTPLHCAVYNGHFNIVELLVNNNTNTDLQNLEGETVLHIAISNDMNSIAECLIEHGCSTDIQNKNGDTPIHIAVYKKMYAVVMQLIKRNANLVILNNRGNTPLHVCLNSSTNIDILEILIKSTDTIRKKYEIMKLQEKLFSENPLTEQNGELNCIVKLFVDEIIRSAVETLINDGFEYIGNPMEENLLIKKLNLENDLESFILILSEAEKDCIKNYIEPLNICNNKGDSILHRAVKYCSYDVFEYLMRNENIDKNLTNADGDTILHLATKLSNLGAVQLILRTSNELLNVQDKNGNAPIHCAIVKEHISIIEYLLHKGCDINIQNKVKNTPLHVAILNERYDVIKFLLQSACVDASIKNKNGNIPLHCAIETGNLNIIQATKEISEDYMNERNIKGESVLHILLKSKKLSCGELDVLIKYLVENRVDYNAQEENMNTVLHLCLEKNLTNSVSYLLSLSGLKIALKNNDGDTALHLMARYDYLAALENVKCDVFVFDIKNNNNDTAFDLAMHYGLSNMAELLLKRKWDLSYT